MRPLPNKFEEGGFSFEVLIRMGLVVLLCKSTSGRPDSFEVVILKVHPAESIHGVGYPERESLPPAEVWGESAWTFSAAQCHNPRKEAEEKFMGIVKLRHSEKKGHFCCPGNAQEGF